MVRYILAIFTHMHYSSRTISAPNTYGVERLTLNPA